MSYSIIGFGAVGQALARAFARQNIEATVASRRTPEALTPQAQAIGSAVSPRTLQDALQADVIFLAWATTVDGDETDSSAYHGWVITPTAEGCHVLTEETQQGEFFQDVIGRQYPGALYRYHQDWVERLAQAAEAEMAKKAD